MTAPAGANPRALEIMRAVNAAMGTKGKPANILTTAADPQFVTRYHEFGLLPFDILTQGGLAAGRFVTLLGDYSTLKSYVGLHAIARTQARGGIAALIDTEHTFDPGWAEACGVDVASLLLLEETPSGEHAIDAAEAMIRNDVDTIVFDSVAAALPQAERDRGLKDEKMQMARLATLMSRAMRKLTAANKNTSVLWTNQLRVNVGIMFGNPEQATGGKSLPYYSSQIIETKRGESVKQAVQTYTGSEWKNMKETVAQQYTANLIKSKLNKPHRSVVFNWNLQSGMIDHDLFVFAQAHEHDLIRKVGASWQVKGEQKKTQGREAMIKRIANDEDLYARLAAQVREVHGLPSLGQNERAPRKGSAPKRTLRSGAARKSIPAAGPDGSRTTRRPQKKSLSSS